MSRSRKDGTSGGGHGRDGSKGMNREVGAAKARRSFKQIMTKNRRRTSKQIEFEETEKHFQFEELEPYLASRLHVHLTRALKRVSHEFLLRSLVSIADKSNLLRGGVVSIADMYDLLRDTGSAADAEVCGDSEDIADWLRDVETIVYDPYALFYDGDYDDPADTHQGIIALIEDKDSWIRPLETWCVETPHPREQFSELLRHLFADYDVPRFMDEAWLSGNRVHQNWFKLIAAGHNIRTASGLPFVLTKKMAHHFLTAPKHYSIAEALRWGQAHALGGNGHLVEALRGTHLVRALDREDTDTQDFWFVEDDFWISVIRFFIQNPMETQHIGPIIDYIRHQKYIGQPAHPNFSMKRRTPEALLREVIAWHQELYRTPEAKKEKEMRQCRWKGSGIGAFHFQQGSRTWAIMELTNKDELHSEGKMMRHCVLTYLKLCMSGKTSIWSMAMKDEGGNSLEKTLTIEVELPARWITQVRGKSNRLPTKEEINILKRWAAKEDLKIPSYYLHKWYG